jgi:hypothetical protein
MSSRIELGAGVLAAVAATIGLGMALFGEFNWSATVTKVNPSWMDRTIWWGHSVDSQIAVYSVVMFVAAVAVARGSYLDVVHEEFMGWIYLACGTLVLVVGAALDLPLWSRFSISGVTGWNGIGIGLWLLPAALLALVSAVDGIWIRSQVGQLPEP